MRNTYLLIVLDGWGLAAAGDANAVTQANTPHWDRLWRTNPHRQLSAAAETVGLPSGQMGNSEVGHLNLGAGRIVLQTLLRIDRAIKDKSFYQQPQLVEALRKVKQSNTTLHILGLLSTGGVHSHRDHLFALCRAAAQQGVRKLSFHSISDGRDTAPGEISKELTALADIFAELGIGVLSSLCGRYYAMDRDKRWQRTEQAYRLLLGKADRSAPTAQAAWEAALAAEETDEFIKPTFIEGGLSIEPEDTLICGNFRADRMRQLSEALAREDFTAFPRSLCLPYERLITMTEYDETLPLPHLFAKQSLKNCLGEVLATAGKKQLRIAETEKFAHVTYFFNGGSELVNQGEERKLIPSLKVATYDLAPAMRAREITTELIAALHSGNYDFILCNYANGDMVGHTGSMKAAVEAVEVLDESLGQLMEAIRQTGAQALITSDHGNCEQMLKDNKPWTAHTMNPVPLIYYGSKPLRFDTQPAGLADIAPTMLKLMNMTVPAEMTGRSLL